MDMRSTVVATIVLFFCVFKVKGDDDLSLTFYNKTCPQLEKIVYDAMKSTTKKDPHTPAAILRLLFHDCRVEGCDASILVDKQGDPDGPEISSPLNFGVKKRELIGEIKSMVDKVCPQQVSCADILVLAARDAVAISGGPTIPVPLGRRDTAVAFSSYNANQNLPDSNGEISFSADNLDRLGTTADENIALLGAHTLGNSHCISIMDRIWGPPDGIPITPGPEYEFVKILKKICPQNSPALNNTLVPNDRTPRTFDNSFFVNILKGHAVIVSDADMARNRKSVEYVRRFASDNEAFLKAFSSAFLKLSKFKVLTGNKGEIRRTCNKLNSDV